MRKPSPNEIAVKTYASKHRLYDVFSLNLKGLVRDLIKRAQIEFHDVECRAKSLESFRKKIERPDKAYADPLREVSDLAGVRVILYYEEDVRKVCRLIEREFVIEKSQSVDKAKSLAEDQFGYRAVHYVITLSKSRQILDGWKDYKGLKAEFQVRTVLQHAWAAFSHKLEYKTDRHIPKQERRRLVRLAGLLELADDEFGRLKKQLLATARRNKRKLSQEIYGLDVDLVSVTEYVRSSEVVDRIMMKFKEVGFQVIDPLGNASQLTSIALGLQIPTIDSLNLALKKSLTRLDDFLPIFMDKNFGKDKNKWMVFPVGGDSDHWSTVALLQSVVKDFKRKDLRQLVSWGDKYFETVVSASQKAFRR